MPLTDEELLRLYFRSEPMVAVGHLPLYSCKNCGSLVTQRSWKIHVVGCPALAKWSLDEAQMSLEMISAVVEEAAARILSRRGLERGPLF